MHRSAAAATLRSGEAGPRPLAARPTSPCLRAPPAGSRALWVRELELLPARLVFELPSPPTFRVSLPGLPAPLRFSPEAQASPRAFDAEEWLALVVATEADRIWPEGLVELCRRKEREPGHRVTLSDALAGAQPDLHERWDVSRVLARWGGALLDVSLPG